MRFRKINQWQNWPRLTVLLYWAPCVTSAIFKWKNSPYLSEARCLPSAKDILTQSIYCLKFNIKYQAVKRFKQDLWSKQPKCKSTSKTGNTSFPLSWFTTRKHENERCDWLNGMSILLWLDKIYLYIPKLLQGQHGGHAEGENLGFFAPFAA